MQYSTKQTRVSVLGSSQSITNTDSKVNNHPVAGWMPGIYDRRAITDPGQRRPNQDESWADLAAAAQGDWGAENPF